MAGATGSESVLDSTGQEAIQSVGPISFDSNGRAGDLVPNAYRGPVPNASSSRESVGAFLEYFNRPFTTN
jgi:hypothetical protein